MISFAVGLAALAATAGQAQAQAPAPTAAPASPFVIVTQGSVAANPADVSSIDAIMRAVYDTISGPAGQKRDWNRLRSLHTSNARLMPLGKAGLRSGGVEDYIKTSGPYLEEKGFHEIEVARRVEQYGDIAHVFSTYEARNKLDGPVFMRGINSFQLVRHGGRWWVVSIMWQQETPDNPIPAKYLPTKTAERG